MTRDRIVKVVLLPFFLTIGLGIGVLALLKPNEDRSLDAYCERALKEKECHEALAWLQADENRTFNVWRRKDTLAFVEDLYRLGATRVTIAKSRSGLDDSGWLQSLIVSLPDNVDAREKMFDRAQAFYQLKSSLELSRRAMDRQYMVLSGIPSDE